MSYCPIEVIYLIVPTARLDPKMATFIAIMSFLLPHVFLANEMIFNTEYRGEIFAPGNGSLTCPSGKKTFQEGSNLDPTRFEVTWRPKSTPWESTTCPKKNQTNSSSGKRVIIDTIQNRDDFSFFVCNQSTIVFPFM